MVPKRLTLEEAISELRDAGYLVEFDHKYIYVRVRGGIGVDKLTIETGRLKLVSAKQVKGLVNKMKKGS